MKKIIWTISIGLVLILLAVLLKNCGGEPALQVTTENAALRTITETVSANGKIQPEVEVKISSDVSGEIVELLVKEGDRVKKGDLLCRINPLIYESNLSRMNAMLSETKANVANSRARLEQVKASYANAEASFQRNKTLYDQGAISKSEFEQAQASYEGARADVKAAEEVVRAAEFSVKSSEASLNEANENLSRTNIYSPVDGTVSKLNKEKGERVVGTVQMEGTEIMRLANLREMEVSVDVNENDIVRVHLGDTSLIEVDAYLGRKFKGVVTEIANSASTTGISAEQVTSFMVKIRILQESYADLYNAERTNAPFRPGMSATVDIQTRTARNVVSVPIQSVSTRSDTLRSSVSTEENEGPDGIVVNDKKAGTQAPEVRTEECAFLFNEGSAKMVKVKTGIQDNNYIEVISGLKAGDEVISGPYSAVARTLKEGAKVARVQRSELFSGTKP